MSIQYLSLQHHVTLFSLPCYYHLLFCLCGVGKGRRIESWGRIWSIAGWKLCAVIITVIFGWCVREGCLKALEHQLWVCYLVLENCVRASKGDEMDMGRAGGVRGVDG